MLALHLQPFMLAGGRRRALLLVASELVMNAMRRAFVGAGGQPERHPENIADVIDMRDVSR
jgi:hypothetical protein